MHCKIAEIKKYIFAGRANWRSNACGMKVTQLYLRVFILLFLKLYCALFLALSLI